MKYLLERVGCPSPHLSLHSINYRYRSYSYTPTLVNTLKLLSRERIQTLMQNHVEQLSCRRWEIPSYTGASTTPTYTCLSIPTTPSLSVPLRHPVPTWKVLEYCGQLSLSRLEGINVSIEAKILLKTRAPWKISYGAQRSRRQNTPAKGVSTLLEEGSAHCRESLFGSTRTSHPRHP